LRSFDATLLNYVPEPGGIGGGGRKPVGLREQKLVGLRGNKPVGVRGQKTCEIKGAENQWG